MSDINLDEYEEIVDVSFDNENPHLAVCSKTQGYSANGWHTSLLMKSEDIQITEDVIKALQQITVKLSFEEFLRRFFGMYSSDAELLTKILGMETEFENYLLENALEDPLDAAPMYLEEALDKFNIMKGAETIKDIPPEDFISILNLQKAFEDGVEQFDITFDEESPQSEGVVVALDKHSDKDDTEVTPSDTNTITITEESMNKDELIKSAEFQELIKAQVEAAKAEAEAIIKAAQDELTEAKEELTKAAEIVNAYKEKEAQKRKEGFTNFVKSLSFVDEENKEGLVEVLMSANDVDGFDLKLIVTQFEKAQEEITKAKTSFVEGENGVETHEEQVDVDKATAIADALVQKYTKVLD